MTPTETRAEINRANSQHSTGPKTPEGKKRISLNALRHGLTGQVVVMTSTTPKEPPRPTWFKPSPTPPGGSTAPPPWKPIS
jgi:hypothetical protein